MHSSEIYLGEYIFYETIETGLNFKAISKDDGIILDLLASWYSFNFPLLSSYNKGIAHSISNSFCKVQKLVCKINSNPFEHSKENIFVEEILRI